MIVFVGASASGKTELAKLLYKIYSYNKCITTTTRMMRDDEKQDIDYHFVSKETFLNIESQGEFVEVTQYQENLYGIQKKDVVMNGVVIVDPTGANSLIKKLSINVFIVYVETNEKLRKSRMIKRGDQLQTIENRMKLDQHVFRPEQIKRINLYVKNEGEALEELANRIHNNYQAYMESLNN
ncbi:AAA family ATPase [Haloplasma contractile]|uniref:Guanylate kinase protein n=1 Tax=Haloplasma contractile SSD-17B TaxID=1033810 RepID=U2DT35_9MOLU|nr:AAA family ATPase [Haloplasma contractile]ERJ11652.1 Guanylate kinase protein [Haloplasma contractile SSD-17B]